MGQEDKLPGGKYYHLSYTVKLYTHEIMNYFMSRLLIILICFFMLLLKKFEFTEIMYIPQPPKIKPDETRYRYRRYRVCDLLCTVLVRYINSR
jgi:hypothetical protein